MSFITLLNTPLFTLIGGVSTLLTIFAFLAVLWSFIKGVSPALWRLGMGLSKRKIAVFAKGDRFSSMQSLLLDSGLFQQANIIQITANNLKKAEGCSIFLVWWADYAEHIGKIIELKKDATGMVVYAPPDDTLPNGGQVPRDAFQLINEQNNALLVNFRGRLLNDILVLMITTNYAKKSA